MKLNSFLQRCFYIYIFFCNFVCVKLLDSFSVEGKLIEDLLQEYNSQVSPVSKKGKFNFSLDMTLSQIISVDEKSQELTTSSYLFHKWEDSRLHWDPEDYDNIKLLRLPAESVWKPRLLLENSKDGSFDVSLLTNVLVWFNGTIEWLPPTLYKSSCTIKIAMFPFDQQSCEIHLISPTFHEDEMEFQLVKETITIDPSAYQDNGEWYLTNTSAKLSKKRNGYLFCIFIKRKPQFYVINIILPCMLLSSLSCLVFYLPSCTCEKFTLSISILLGQTVFFFLIAQRTPETSMAVPLIGTYILFVMSLVVFSVISSVVICNVNFRSNNTHDMPVWIKWIFFDLIAPILKVKRPNSIDEEEMEQMDDKTKEEDSMFDINMHKASDDLSPSQKVFKKYSGEYGISARINKRMTDGSTSERIDDFSKKWYPPSILGLSPIVWSTIQSICYVAKRKKQEDKKSQSQDDWAYVALILDRFLLWIYCITFLFGSIGFSLKAEGY